jgi:predicted dinucleotide-binding enzyme
MDIAIIGAGSVGTALATTFARAGHDVTITSRDPEHASATAATSGAHVVATAVEATRAADVIVLAVWIDSVPQFKNQGDYTMGQLICFGKAG